MKKVKVETKEAFNKKLVKSFSQFLESNPSIEERYNLEGCALVEEELYRFSNEELFSAFEFGFKLGREIQPKQ